ncbi:hypothetical protein, partial [Branchiibius sp. NY16-3462-2]|uniref:hypothetical protein n=1 Tax=Branchiibius sp. NY16-3462-2 TaxID=1807500 RepID=UPI0025BD37F8
MHDERRTDRLRVSAALGFAIAALSAIAAVRLGVVAGRELAVDVRGESAPSAVFLHVLLMCVVPLLLWLALAFAAAGTDIARVLRAGASHADPRTEGRRSARRHIAAVLLALTGAGALGTLPSAPALAGPLPPGTTQSAPLATAMDVPVPPPPVT